MTHILTPIMAARPVTVSTVWPSAADCPARWLGARGGAATVNRPNLLAASPVGSSMLQVHKGISRPDVISRFNFSDSLNQAARRYMATGLAKESRSGVAA